MERAFENGPVFLLEIQRLQLGQRIGGSFEIKVDFTTVFSFAFIEILRLESFVECREQNIVRIEMGVVVFDNGVDGDAVFPNGVDV